ncbi:MAG: hypothetical protein AAFX85_18835 [Pseudomonadota bacterium]
MLRIQPTAAAVLLGFCTLTVGTALQAGHLQGADGYQVALYTDDSRNERVVVIRHDRDVATGLEGTGYDARLLRQREIEGAARRIRELAKEDGVSVVDIDTSAAANVMIMAEDSDEDHSAYIHIGEGGIVIHADGEDGENVHIAFGDPDKGDKRGGVRVHARDSDDGSDRAVVLMRDIDEGSVREFIADLDEVPRDLKREMLRDLGL